MNGVGKHLAKLVLPGLLAATPVLADVPTQMPIQGRLTNSSGAPVPAGLKFFTFKIFDAASGGTEIWPAGLGETQTLASDVNGLWSGSIGLLVPLTPDVFQSPVRWLQITVDNGVDPAETLPRLQLKTNPYTYRSATSQHADSLGGSTLFDLALRFVDESGDVMTGVLENNFTQNNAGASLRVHNFNDGWGSHWNDVEGNWGLATDVGGDDANFNVGVAGSAGGNDNIADANYGLLGFAAGTGSINIGVYASTVASGTENYSAYFFGGDVVVSFPATPGTGGVVLPADAIDASEILNEPGIAYDNSILDASMAPSNTGTDIVSVSVLTPSTGYVVVTGTVVFRFSGTTGANYAWINLDSAGTDNSLFNSTWYWAGSESHAGVSSEYQTLTATRVFNLPAGAYTFEIIGNGYDNNAIGAAASVWSANVLATYVPTSYGGVDALVADASGFEHSSAVRPIGGEPVSRDVTFHEVDLRELEVRAARFEAAAERARRELVEAKLSATHGGVRALGTSVKEPKQ